MAVSKRVRYEVLRRDNYTCRYCGAKAPDVEITVDHVVPVALGGTDDPSNLVAACRPCNNGKTSSSPDAPLVADVSDKAVQWAAAMQAASAQMLADIDARQADREQFREWWNAWGTGEGKERRTVPLDPDWESTVDQFLAAGLPLDVLKICIDSAMRRKKVASDHTFRYMCGIAWRKVGELREVASSIASGNAPAAALGAGVSPYEQGRLDFARELLSEISEEERAYYLETSDMTAWQDEDDDPQTETQMACEAVGYALNSARSNLDWLVSRLKETLPTLPEGLGELCMVEWSAGMTIRDPLSRAACEASGALYALEDVAHLPAATAYLDGLPEEERAEWIVFAKALYHRAKLSDERWLVRAADCARTVKSDLRYTDMCSASGEHIPDCPARGTHYARIDGLTCCEQEASDHKGHLVCERHLEQLIDGAYVGRNGKLLVAADFTEAEAETAVPF